VIELILLGASILLYMLAEGCTEGYTWANPVQRKLNILICGSKISRLKPKGKLDYHTWRNLENIGIGGAIFSAFLFTSFLGLVLTTVAFFCIGLFIYELALNYINEGKFHVDKVYRLGNLEIPFPWWLKFLPLLVGLILILTILF